MSTRHSATCAVVVLCFVVACGGSTAQHGSTPSTPDESDASDDASTTPADAGLVCTGFDDAGPCKACEEALCCAPNAHCRNDASCAAIVACFTGCSDTSCIQQCESEHPDGTDLFQEWATCRLGSCANECRK